MNFENEKDQLQKLGAKNIQSYTNAITKLKNYTFNLNNCKYKLNHRRIDCYDEIADYYILIGKTKSIIISTFEEVIEEITKILSC